MNKLIGVTGASGFIGQSLVIELLSLGYSVRAQVRSLDFELKIVESKRANLEIFNLGNIDLNTDWTSFLNGVDCIIHCAGHAHSPDLKSKIENLDLFRLVNVGGTRSLVEQSVEANVKRFIYISSLKVNGNQSNLNEPISAFSPINPEDAYGLTKHEAEVIVNHACASNKMQGVVIRPALVYGPNVKGNMLRLLKFINFGYPLPFDSIKNQRSFLCIDNLVNLLILCINHPKAPGHTFMASDNESLSTPDLLRRLATIMNKKSFIFPMPIKIIYAVAFLTGCLPELNRLIGSLHVDITHTKKILDWSPPITLEEGLRKMVIEFKST